MGRVVDIDDEESVNLGRKWYEVRTKSERIAIFACVIILAYDAFSC
jgi:hypothetical protein